MEQGIALDTAQKSFVDRLVTKPPGTHALHAFGGSGKTATVCALTERLHDECALGDVVLCATTHKAVGVLRGKIKKATFTDKAGIKKKRAIITPITLEQALYRSEMTEVGLQVMALFGGGGKIKEDVLHDFFGAQYDKLITAVGEPDAQYEGVLQSLSYDPYAVGVFMTGNKTRRPAVGGMLIVDEASMMTYAQLADAQSTYRTVLLVGDSMQLPPVLANKQTQEKTVLEIAKHTYALHTNHRSNTSPDLIAALARVRAGVGLLSLRSTVATFKYELPESPSFVEELPPSIPVLALSNASVHNMNRLRFKHNYAADTHPGYIESGYLKGELVDLIFKRGCVFFKHPGSGFMVRARFQDDEEGAGYTVSLAYALTCHKAQGSEWPHVAIDVNSQRTAYGLESAGNAAPGYATRWVYTALSRAKEAALIFDFQCFKTSSEHTEALRQALFAVVKRKLASTAA